MRKGVVDSEENLGTLNSPMKSKKNEVMDLIKTIMETLILMIIIRAMEIGNNSKSRHINKNTTNNQWHLQ